MTVASEAAEENRRPSPELIVTNVAFVILLVAISWGVLSRYVVAAPATWVEEVSSIAFAWLTFVGAAEVHRRGWHVSVDLLTSFLPEGVRNPLARAVDVIVILFCLGVAWLGLQQVIASHVASTSMLNIPLSVPYAGLALGFALIAVRGAQRLIHQVRIRGA